MGELFSRKEEHIAEAKSFFSKIAYIWKDFITQKDWQEGNLFYSTIDEYYYAEAIQHL